MQLPADVARGAAIPAGSDAALAVLLCARSLAAASQHVLVRLRDGGARVRLGRLGDRCAGALGALEHALAGAELPAPMGAQRVPHGLRSVIEVGGVGADLGLLLELDVVAARLQARIEGLLAHGASPALRETLCTLSAWVREIRAEYELYVA
jgi:hypothetical protein